MAPTTPLWVPEPSHHPFLSTIFTLIFVYLVWYYVTGVVKAARSPLSSIPGPWYACVTTLHLNYAFATGKVWKNVEQAHRKYGPIFRLGPRQVWISDRDAIKQILSTVDLPKVTMYSEIARDRMNPGLFGEIRYDPHKRLKRFLSPAFTVGYVDKLEIYFASCIQDLIKKYDRLIGPEKVSGSEGPVCTDLMDDIHSLALDIMGECSLGRGFGQIDQEKEIDLNIDNEAWRRIPKAIFKGMTRRYQMVYFKRLLRRWGIEVMFDWPREMITAIQAIIDERQQLGISRPDLLQHLVDQGENPESQVKMNARDVTDQMGEIYLAGSETTSGTIACLFLEVLRAPDVKKKLMDSLPIRGKDDPVITSKEVRTEPQYEYLEACIKEVLRLHPIASEMGRRTTSEPVELMGYVLPPYTVVSASYRDLHRNPTFWPQPLRFWPERWLENRPPNVPAPDLKAYYPFSAGKHSCIGINFAWAEIRMVTANLFSRYEFREVPNQIIDYRQYITMQFATGSWKTLIQPRYHSMFLNSA